jgi:hypothetical protein
MIVISELALEGERKWVGFRSSPSIAAFWIDRVAAAAEVVGSNPTRFIFITLGNYGIKLGSF